MKNVYYVFDPQTRIPGYARSCLMVAYARISNLDGTASVFNCDHSRHSIVFTELPSCHVELTRLFAEFILFVRILRMSPRRDLAVSICAEPTELC